LALYVACTAIRLGRFNVQADKSVFFGLNSPSAAALVIFVVWSVYDAGSAVATRQGNMIIGACVFCAALLMVSPFRYISTKKLAPVYPQTRLALLAVATVLACTLAFAPYSLYGCALLYAVSGPLSRLMPRR
ncbi:MAG: hypothetical protein JO142_21060, partial [Burkholderiales bacterium]|nr:hypothetical protein [Burkholderiales bacterium]